MAKTRWVVNRKLGTLNIYNLRIRDSPYSPVGGILNLTLPIETRIKPRPLYVMIYPRTLDVALKNIRRWAPKKTWLLKESREHYLREFFSPWTTLHDIDRMIMDHGFAVTRITSEYHDETRETRLPRPMSAGRFGQLVLHQTDGWVRMEDVELRLPIVATAVLSASAELRKTSRSASDKPGPIIMADARSMRLKYGHTARIEEPDKAATAALDLAVRAAMESKLMEFGVLPYDLGDGVELRHER